MPKTGTRRTRKPRPRKCRLPPEMHKARCCKGYRKNSKKRSPTFGHCVTKAVAVAVAPKIPSFTANKRRRIHSPTTPDVQFNPGTHRVKPKVRPHERRPRPRIQPSVPAFSPRTPPTPPPMTGKKRSRGLHNTHSSTRKKRRVGSRRNSFSSLSSQSISHHCYPRSHRHRHQSPHPPLHLYDVAHVL